MEQLNTKGWFKVIATGIAVLFIQFSFAQYCTPTYTTGTIEGDYIDGVELGSISNTGTGGSITGVGYSDYTSLSTDLATGLTYEMTVTNTPTYPENYTAWIDYDQDFIFETDEVLGSVNLLASGSANITFTVPPSAMAGTTRMRVMCVYFGVTPLDPCGTASYGEAEDYNVNISSYTNNLAITDITSPVSATTLGAENITITVNNYGDATDGDITLSYSVDGGPTVSEAYPTSIAAGASISYTFTSTYDFSADGCYSINASLSYAPDEYEGDNTYTESVCNLGTVTGTGAWYIYSNVYGGAEPWFSTTNSDAMNTIFGVGSWNQGFFETVDPLSVFTPDNCTVFLDGSDAMADELESFLTTNATTIENWVSSGGKLFLNSAPNEGDGMSFGFGGVTLNYAYYTASAHAIDATHPIFNGPNLPVGTTWTGSSFAHAWVSGDGLTNLITDDLDATKVVLAEKTWGDGRVLFGGMTTNNFHTPALESANLRANIIAYQSCLTFTDVCSPLAPGGLYADGVTSSSATLNWNVAPSAEQYVVSLWNLSTGEIKKKHVFTNSIYISSYLTPSTTYGFRVKTVCYAEGTISPYSDWYYFTTGPGKLGEFDEMVKVYPNPSDGNFNLQLNGYENTQVQLIISNSTGQIVFNNNVNVSENAFIENISLPDMAQGMYQLKVINGDNVVTNNIIIQ